MTDAAHIEPLRILDDIITISRSAGDTPVFGVWTDLVLPSGTSRTVALNEFPTPQSATRWIRQHFNDAIIRHIGF